MEFKDLKTIGQLFPLPKLKLKEEEVKDWCTKNPFTQLYQVKDNTTFLGIEVETENVRSYDPEISPFWIMTEDGSLRNKGKEFITIPTRASRIEQALTILFDSQLNKDIDFSERTSIHVHLNVRTFTTKQLMGLLLTYLTFEKALFNWVGHSRSQNVFCNPLTDTEEIKSLYTVIRDIPVNGIRWQKYCALNLAPIVDKGTIEFRHLYGTKTVKTILSWINMILSLKLFALKNDPALIFERILSLNTSSEYRALAKEIFTDQIDLLTSYDNFDSDCYDCTAIIKEQVYKGTLTSRIKSGDIDPTSPLGKYLIKNPKSLDKLIRDIRENTPAAAAGAIDDDWLDELPQPIFQQLVAQNAQRPVPPPAPQTLDRGIGGTTLTWEPRPFRIEEEIITNQLVWGFGINTLIHEENRLSLISREERPLNITERRNLALLRNEIQRRQNNIVQPVAVDTEARVPF